MFFQSLVGVFEALLRKSFSVSEDEDKNESLMIMTIILLTQEGVSKLIHSHSLRIVRELFYGCLSRNDRPTDKMVFTRTRSTIVLHGMYLCQRAFEPGYSSPEMRILFAGNLYAVCVKFLTCSP